MWIAPVGTVALWVAVVAALAACAGLYLGDRLGRPELIRGGRLAFAILLASVALAVGLLETGLIRNNFALSYVAEHSSLQTPLLYRIGALWGGARGSLLLWLFVLCAYGGFILAHPPREARTLLPAALSIMAAVSAFFAFLVAGPALPFATLAHAPADGAGLNRLLRDAAFLVHPVVLYLGYVGFTVPFAFGMAGLIKGETGDQWIRVTQRWALTAWALLSVGILVGANWSYHVLGWGGYWSFDPVENVALLPWLTGTAFIHSAMVQERRGMLKVWNAALVAGTYILTLFGTFLTRSGVATESQHTFSSSPVGGYLLAAVGMATALAVYLIGSRLELLADDRRYESLVSKEGAFLLNNVVFLSISLTVLVGTLVPILSPYFGQEVSIGTPYFERVTAPLFTVVLLLAGIGPLLAWRRAGWREFVRHLLVPLCAAAVFAFVLAAAGVHPLSATIGLACAFFAGVAVLFDFGLGVAARLQMENTGVLTAAYRLVARNPRRYGGYAVHLAIAIIACGVVASHAFQQQAEFPLRVGQTAEVGGYDFTYEGVGTTLGAGIQTSYARVTVTRRGQFVANMLPAAFVGTDAATASAPTFLPAIAPGFYRDLYIVLEGYDQGGATAALNVIINPLVDWIWAGGVLLVAGSVFSLWPRRAMLAAPRSHRIFALWSELEYDYRMGKTPEPEYLALRAQYAAEAERALGAERAEDAARRSVAALESRIAARVAEIARLGSGEPALAVAAAPAGEGERG